MRLKSQVKTESMFGNWIYAACLIMMAFFLIGYIICMVDYIIKIEVLMSDLLIATIFFFGAIFVFSVVTMIQRMFTAISEKSHLLVKAKDAAERSNHEKTRFLSTLSHEIRTPLNTIIGMNELILNEDISGKIVEYALHAKKAGSYMLAQVNELLDISRIEAGKLALEQTEYSFATLINDTINLMHTRINKQKILFTADVDSNIPGNLVGDPRRIKEIYLNLLSNAVKYTNEGYVSIKVRCDETETGVDLIADISDSGIGIKAESMELLFQLFFRENTLDVKGVEGTGLGLAISKKLCKSMGGDIRVVSEVGVGSTFTVKIPQKINNYVRLAEVENPKEKTVLLYEPRTIYAKSLSDCIKNLGVRCVLAVSVTEFYSALEEEDFKFIFVPSFFFRTESRLGELEQKSRLVLMTEFDESIFVENVSTFSMPVCSTTIANILNETVDSMVSFYSAFTNTTAFTAPTAKVLVVDDLGTNLIVAKGMLSKYGIQAQTCKSGIDAIELVKQSRYDIIFMDHEMIEMNGIEATAAIRALKDENGYYQNVPIIALTANAVSGMKEMFLQNQMSDFLSKPIEMVKLEKILKKWVPEEKQAFIEIGEAEKTQEKDHSQPQIVIDGIDVQMGIIFNGGEVESYLKTLNVFYGDLVEKPQMIREYLENNELMLYKTTVHGIKSSALAVGAKELSGFAKDLEGAANRMDKSYILKNTDAFIDLLEKLSINIYNALSDLRDEEKEQEASNRKYLSNSLSELRTA